MKPGDLVLFVTNRPGNLNGRFGVVAENPEPAYEVVDGVHGVVVRLTDLPHQPTIWWYRDEVRLIWRADMDIVSEIGRICLDCGKRKPDFPVHADLVLVPSFVCVCVTYRTGSDNVTVTVKAEA